MEILLIFLAFLGFTFGCDLVPGNPRGSCQKLKSTPLITSSTSQFGPFIEGASINPKGDIFAVNYGNSSTIYTLGQIYPSQRLFYSDSYTDSLLHGIRFLDSETAFVVDAVNHRVLKLDVAPSKVGDVVVKSSVFCSDPTMLEPNDLTLSKTGTIFTSGMRYLSDTNNTDGDIWSCTPDGRAKKLEVIGRTNGIDLSPDEKTLYVSESYNRGGTPYVQKIWKYDVNVAAGTIRKKVLFADFKVIDGSVQNDIDGMRTDVNGNLFVTRHGGSQVVIFNTGGVVIGKIKLSFPKPTNLEFGGKKGSTLFVVGKCKSADKGCVDTIKVTSPGRSWSILQ